MVTLGKAFVLPIPDITVPVLDVQASATATISLKGSLQDLALELFVDFCAQLGFAQTACTKQLGLGPIRLIELRFRLGKPTCNN